MRIWSLFSYSGCMISYKSFDRHWYRKAFPPITTNHDIRVYRSSFSGSIVIIFAGYIQEEFQREPLLQKQPVRTHYPVFCGICEHVLFTLWTVLWVLWIQRYKQNMSRARVLWPRGHLGSRRRLDLLHRTCDR